MLGGGEAPKPPRASGQLPSGGCGRTARAARRCGRSSTRRRSTPRCTRRPLRARPLPTPQRTRPAATAEGHGAAHVDVLVALEHDEGLLGEGAEQVLRGAVRQQSVGEEREQQCHPAELDHDGERHGREVGDDHDPLQLRVGERDLGHTEHLDLLERGGERVQLAVDGQLVPAVERDRRVLVLPAAQHGVHAVLALSLPAPLFFSPFSPFLSIKDTYPVGFPPA